MTCAAPLYAGPMRQLLLVLACALGAVSGIACDVCSAMAKVHVQRCNDGDQSSCEWLVESEYSGGVCG